MSKPRLKCDILAFGMAQLSEAIPQSIAVGVVRTTMKDNADASQARFLHHGNGCSQQPVWVNWTWHVQVGFGSRAENLASSTTNPLLGQNRKSPSFDHLNGA
jgi:hypothetical protein